MSVRRRVLTLTLAAAPFAAIEGCSLIAHYDPVDHGSTTPDSGLGDDSSLGLDGSVGDAAATPDGPITDASTGDRSNSVDGQADTAAPLPPKGVLVVVGSGAVDGGTAYVLSVLDSATGTELSRERRAIVGMSYDGATGYWFLFELLNPGAGTFSTGPETVPGSPVVLHVRTLDTNSGKWTEVTAQPVQVPAIAALNVDYVAPLNGRLAYVAWNPMSEASSLGYDLVTIDVSVPSAPVAAPNASGVTITHLTQGPISMIGTRAVGVPGGEVNLIQSSQLGTTTACTTFGQCQFELQPIRIAQDAVTKNDSATQKGKLAIGSPYPGGAPMAAAGGSFLNMGAPRDVIAFPSVATDDAGNLVVLDGGGLQPGPGLLQQFDPNMNTTTSDPTVPFPADAVRYSPVVFDECLKTAILGESNGGSLFALPLTANATQPPPVSVGHLSSIVRFDPYTNTAFTSFNSTAAKVISAYRVGGTPMAPTLSLRNDWNPPADLAANIMAVVQPTPAHFTCQPDGGITSN
jgi:hypothetical protein